MGTPGEVAVAARQMYTRRSIAGIIKKTVVFKAVITSLKDSQGSQPLIFLFNNQTLNASYVSTFSTYTHTVSILALPTSGFTTKSMNKLNESH